MNPARSSISAPLAWATVVLLVAGLATAAGRIRSGEGSAAPARPVATRVALPPMGVDLLSVDVAGGDRFDRHESAAGVVDVLTRYVQLATEAPLRTGEAGDGLAELFTEPARHRLATPERSVLVDEGLPRPATVEMRKGAAAVTLLSPPGGAPEVAVATLDIVVAGIGGEIGALRLHRAGEMVLVNQAGAWLIDSFDLRVAVDTSPVLPLDDMVWPFSVHERSS